MSEPALATISNVIAPKPSTRPLQRVMRKKIKAVILSPEAKQANEKANQKMIEEFINSGRMQKLAPMWANGACNTTLINIEG